MALGAGNVQVCTAAMHYGFRIVEEMIDGLSTTGWTRRATRRSTTSSAAPCRNVTDWQYLNLNYVTKARIDQDLCIKCGRCHIACEDTSHQAITAMKRRRAALRGDRRGVRRLQSLRQRLPGRGLHHHARDRPAACPTLPGPRTPATRSICHKRQSNASVKRLFDDLRLKGSWKRGAPRGRRCGGGRGR